MENTSPHIFVSGHKSPDMDSLAAAVALTELRRRQGWKDISAVCPGVVPERAKHLFAKFKVPLPEVKNDLYVRVKDVMQTPAPVIDGGTSLLNAVRKLHDSRLPRLPVVDAGGKFLGMLSPLALLSQLLNVGAGKGLAGRDVRTTLQLIAEVINAPLPPEAREAEVERTFSVYVGAMGADSFDEHLPRRGDLVVIVGDRPEIHLRALQRQIRVLIVTGGKPVEPLILAEAKRKQVTVLPTDFDSATVIRRLKFSMPVENCVSAEGAFAVSSNARLKVVAAGVVNQPEDVIPVIDGNQVVGILLKRHVNAAPPFAMILVDHNEISQSLPGVEDLPVTEVVDPHRIGMPPTAAPIKFTGDVVGSTCTLVASMFKGAGESLTPELAGLLLGGIVSDTLNLLSPTTAALDRRMVEWLEKLAGVKADELMRELAQIASPLVSRSADEVIAGDRKSYVDGKFSFSLSQVEESDLELLNQRAAELEIALRGLAEREKLDFVGLMVTDAVRGCSRLMILGNSAVIEALPGDRISPGIIQLPGVVSRKKQLLPQILAVTAALSRN